MPARDRLHDAVKDALVRDGWTITHDPPHPMDAPAEWRDLIERILTEETRIPFSYGEITLYTVFDRPRDHYLLMAIGWDGKKRVHASLIHVDIIDGKLWIQHDGTERGIALDLEAGGVPKDRIVLAFQHIGRRRFGDYAAA